MGGLSTFDTLNNNSVVNKLFNFARQQEIDYVNLWEIVHQKEFLKKISNAQLQVQDIQGKARRDAERDRFRGTLSQYRARLAASGADVARSSLGVTLDLRNQQDRRERNIEGINALNASLIELNRDRQMSQLNTAEMIGHIKRKYAIISGQVEAAGKVLGGISAGSGGAIALPF